MDNSWQEAGGAGGETWKPENAGDNVTGLYKQKKENVGANNSMMYVLQEDGKDETTSVWGSTVLDTKFEEIPTGSLVKIEYLGKEKGKSPVPYKNFKVMYKAPTPADAFPGAEEV